MSEEWDEQDAANHAKREIAHQQDIRQGACDDSHEVTAPFIEILPDDSGKENGSPLNFNNNDHSAANSLEPGQLRRRGTQAVEPAPKPKTFTWRNGWPVKD